MDLTYSLRLGAKPRPMEQDEAAVEKLRYELFPGFCYGGGQAPVSCDCPHSRLLQTWGRGGKTGISAQDSLVLDMPAKKQETEQGKQDVDLPFFDPLACLPLALQTQ